MKILIDIGHPAHVHLFKNFAKEMIDKSHEVLFTCRDKEFEVTLLKQEGFQFKSFGKKYKSLLGKVWGMLKFDWKEFNVARKFKPDLFLSHGSPYAAHVAWLLRKPCIAMEDTGNKEQMRLYVPFTDAILTPDSISCSVGKKQIRYSGYHELAYLHPNNFQHLQSGHSILGLKPGEKYFIIRFVGWNASHDMGLRGLSVDNKKELITYLKRKGRVFITSEKRLPKDFEPYRITISPEKIHDVLCDAQLLVSEGGTMASEGAMLGVPTIFICSSIDSPLASVLRQQEREGLLTAYKDFDGVMDKIKEILKNTAYPMTCKRNLLAALSYRIDVVAFMVWFIENWPQSYEVMKNNPEYQFNFK